MMSDETRVSMAEAGRWLMLSRERVRQLVEAGYIPSAAKGQTHLLDAVQGYIRFSKDEERQASKSAAEGRLRDAKARRVEMQIAKEERELITPEEAMSTHDRMAGLFLESVSGMPARITKDPVERRRLDDLFAIERERLSNRFAEIGDELEMGRRWAEVRLCQSGGGSPLGDVSERETSGWRDPAALTA